MRHVVKVWGVALLAIAWGCNSSVRPPVESGGATGQGVQVQAVVAGASFPVAMAIAADGRIFYTEKETGNIRIIASNGQLLDTAFASVPVNVSSEERGLLGIALHPDFASNGFVYVYYTHSTSGLRSTGLSSAGDDRVVRFTAAGNVAAGDETLIFSLLASSTNHNGGNIHFGPDGKLYITIGDLFDTSNAQRIDTLPGKILRINDDGSIPNDNPFGAGNATYALGLRNSFDFTFDPVGGQIFATENGPTRHDETNLILRGANYGWPNVQGTADGLPGDPAGETSFVPQFGFYVDPLTDTTDGVVVPTGIDVAPNSTFGTDSLHQLFVAEFNTGRIIRYTLNADRNAVTGQTIFAQGIAGGITDLAFAADGTLYVSTTTNILHVVPAE